MVQWICKCTLPNELSNIMLRPVSWTLVEFYILIGQVLSIMEGLHNNFFIVNAIQQVSRTLLRPKNVPKKNICLLC